MHAIAWGIPKASRSVVSLWHSAGPRSDRGLMDAPIAAEPIALMGATDGASMERRCGSP